MLTLMSGLVVKELTPSLRDDFLLFFDHVAFADNPDWGDCYCTMYYRPPEEGLAPGQSKEDWMANSAAENRRLASNSVAEAKVHGFLAYDNGKPVAWCNAGPRRNYPALSQFPFSPGYGDDERVGSIVCFVIACTHRNQGIASRLLDTACEKFSQDGLRFAEAYPVKNAESAADNFQGPLSMYLKAGFTKHRDTDWYMVVRKRL